MAKVMIVGNGGREHALGWSIAQDPEVEEVLYAKGNPGTAAEEKSRNVVVDAKPLDGTKKVNFEKLADIVEKESIEMIVVGPEQPLLDGITDFFHDRGYTHIFGPTARASQIEADKFLSEQLMASLGIPRAASYLCPNPGSARKWIPKVDSEGVVLKPRGPTGGKGVLVCGTKEEALAKLDSHAEKYGHELLVVERLFGQEFSVFGIADGKSFLPIETAVQDHKPLYDNDQGPNTGGMGAYCPVPIADADIVRRAADTMMTPIIRKLAEIETPYTGFLYAGMIMTVEGPKVLEYNCRLGDPETQALVMMLKSGLYQPIKLALEGRLHEASFPLKEGAACCVVMASDGYGERENFATGFPISGLKETAAWHVKVFHAGTAIDDKDEVVTASGRVLGVTSYSEQGLAEALEQAYASVQFIDAATMGANNRNVFHYRTDIGAKGLK